MSKITEMSTFLINFCSISILSKSLDTLMIDVCHHNKRARLTHVSKTKDNVFLPSQLYVYVSLSSTPSSKRFPSIGEMLFLSFASRFFSDHGDQTGFNHPSCANKQGKPMRGVITPLSPWWPISLNSGYRNT